MNGLEPVRGKDGLWRLRFLSMTGGYKRGDDGEPLTFPTKAEAVKARRAAEAQMENIRRDPQDRFIGKVDRGRRRR